MRNCNGDFDSVVGAVATDDSKSQETENNKLRTQDRMRQALSGKSQEALIELHLGLHSLLAQQIVEQKKLQSEYERIKQELKNQKNENIKLQRELSEHSCKLKQQICESCLEQKQTTILKRPIIAGLPQVSYNEKRFPGKAPLRIPPPEAIPKASKVCAPKKVNIFNNLLQKSAPHVIKSNKITLFWPQTESSPSNLNSKLNTKSLLIQKGNDKVIPSQTETPSFLGFNLSGCIFDHKSVANDLIESIKNDPRLTSWFTKQSKQTAKPVVTKQRNAVRPTCLSATASQKYHIIVRCFKKEFEGKEGWKQFKQNILQCNLTKSQISLLLETVPDKDSVEHQRRWSEWQEAVARVTKLKKENIEEPLYEDEEFVYYLSTIPELYKRLECMLVMTSFDELLNRINEFIDVLMDVLEFLVLNQNLTKLFQVILQVGNYLNENTHLGNRTWFHMATLQKVYGLRGVGPDSKSLIYLLASHLGAIFSKKEISLLQKAAQITLISVVDQVKQVEDIFGILSEESQNKEHLMKKRRRNSILPGLSDSDDRFSEIGTAFVQREKTRFIDLQQSLDQLLKNYKVAVTYFGDYNAFIPIDKKIEDEKNPGQQKYVPDLYQVLSDFFIKYELALEAVNNDIKTDLALKRAQSLQNNITKKKTNGKTGSIKKDTEVEPKANSVVDTSNKDSNEVDANKTSKNEANQSNIDVNLNNSLSSTNVNDENDPNIKDTVMISIEPDHQIVQQEKLKESKSNDLTEDVKEETEHLLTRRYLLNEPENKDNLSFLSFEMNLKNLQRQKRTSIFSNIPSSAIGLNDIMQSSNGPKQEKEAQMRRRRESLKAVTGYLSFLAKPSLDEKKFDSKYSKIFQRLKTDHQQPKIAQSSSHSQKIKSLNILNQSFGKLPSYKQKLDSLREEDT